VQAGEIVFSAMSTYRADQEAFKHFVKILVQANVLTARDGELSERSPQIIKLARIAGSRSSMPHRCIVVGPDHQGLRYVRDEAPLGGFAS